jgi:hypothetical protein
MRGLSTFIVIVTIFALAACGGGSGRTGPRLAPSDDAGQVSPVAPPLENELSREQELAKLDNLEPPEGIDLVLWNELKAALAALLPEKIVCTPPIGEGMTVTDLDFFRDDEEAGWLIWSYQLQGDYNVDGAVNVDDLTPIAESYGEIIGEENAWLSLLDFSGDGIVDIADVTGIALNYGFELAGFTVISGGPGFIDWEYIGTVERSEAEALMGGVLLFSFAVEPEDWSDFAVMAHDIGGATGEMSNALEYRQPRIISVDSPSGSIGDFYTARAVVEGEEPFVYDWILTNGVTPNRSDEVEPAVELVQQGFFSGYLLVSNRFDERRHDFSVTVGVPPAIASVEPLAAIKNERTEFSAEVTGSSSLTYSWDFGADAFPRRSSETQPDIEFDENGTHYCSLRVTNTYGDVNLDFEVSVGSPPEIVNITPTQGTRGETERFFAEVLGSEPFNYSWTFTGVGDPYSSTDERPLVELLWPGEHMCKLVVSNAYGDATRWFDFYVGEAPVIHEILWTTTVGNTVCYYFAGVTGDFPMTWTWTFDMFAPDPPLVLEGIPCALLTPGTIGSYDCQLEAENAFGSDTFDFVYEITEIEEPPM